MIFRFPDKPIETTPEFVETLREQFWLAQDKYDGWQVQVHWDGGNVEVYSSSGAHTTSLKQGSSIFASPSLVKMEWVGPRGSQVQELYILDANAWGNEWLTDMTFEKRWSLCLGLQEQIARIPGINLASTFTENFLARFEKLKADWLQSGERISLCEGIVLKKRSGLLSLDLRRAAKSNSQYKLKFRDIDRKRY